MEYVIRNDGGSKRTVKISLCWKGEDFSDTAAEEEGYLGDRNRGNDTMLSFWEFGELEPKEL